jgi:aminoglycoside 3-N-acetyltransferase
MFSVLCYGDTSNIVPKPEVRNSFGIESLFGRLVDINTTVLIISAGAGTTLIHEIERRIGVPYRFDKEFKCLIKETPASETKSVQWTAYVRKLEIQGSEADFNRLTKEFLDSDGVKIVSLGKSYLIGFEIQKLFSFLQEKLALNPYYLTRRGSIA